MNFEDSTPAGSNSGPVSKGGGEARRDRPPRSRNGRSGERSGGPSSGRGGRERSERPGGRDRGGRGDRPGRSQRDEPKDNRANEKPAEAKAPAAKGGHPREAVSDDLIASVSRSFSITLKLLPAPVREPITLGYLLARAQDTIADTTTLPAGARLEHLRALLDMVKYGPDAEVLRPLERAVTGKQTHDGERALLKQLEPCLAWLESSPVDDRWELRRTLARIGRAQELDLLRFGDAKADSPKALETAAELDEYTYLIAGCVGELWTRLCRRHLGPKWSKLEEAHALAMGKRYGQGLQMVNILRDLPEDLANGRCYLPLDLLAQHGLAPTDLRNTPSKARPLLDALRKQAVEHFDAAWTYVKALDSRNLRYACALPLFIGLETLGLLAKTSSLESSERLKISRGSVAGLMASAKLGTLFNPWLSRLHSKLRQRAV